MYLLAHARLLLLAAFVSVSNGDRKSKFLEELLQWQAKDDNDNLTHETPFAKTANEHNEDKVEGFDLDVQARREKVIEAVSQVAGPWDDNKERKLRYVLRALLAMLDADADGHVTRGEMMSGCFNVFAMLYVAGGPKSPQELCRIATGVCGHSGTDPLYPVDQDRLAKIAFDYQDENGDGVVTKEESAKTQFATGLYLNRDFHSIGLGSPAQLCEAIAEAETTTESEKRFRLMDANKNSVVSAQEYRAYVYARVN